MEAGGSNPLTPTERAIWIRRLTRRTGAVRRLYARRVSELTPIFDLSDRFVAEAAALDPYNATRTGVAGFDDRITDYSPDGCAAQADHCRTTLRELGELAPANDDDRRAQQFLSERLEVMLDMHAAHEWMRPLRPIASPVTMIRSSFDLMDRQGDEAWGNIATRLELVPRALDGVRAALEAGARPAPSPRSAKSNPPRPNVPPGRATAGSTR